MTHDQRCATKPKAPCCCCGERPRRYSNGWCKPCWNRWDYAGRLGPGPPPRRCGRWDEYAELTREMGHSLRQAAERMGISVRTAWRYEARISSNATTEQDVA